MSEKKRRRDSKLWTLPPPVQATVYDLCGGPEGYEPARQFLIKEHNVNVKSDATFSAWWSRYPFSLSANVTFAQQFEQEMAKLPEMQGDAEKLSKLGQVGFEMMAMRMQDIEGYVSLKKIRLKEGEHNLAERRLKIVEDKMAQAKAKLEGLKSKGGLSAETLKQIEEAAAIL
jgi:hypothetical protein